MKLLWRSWDKRPEGDRGVKDIKLACLGLIHRINVYIWTTYEEAHQGLEVTNLGFNTVHIGESALETCCFTIESIETK